MSLPEFTLITADDGVYQVTDDDSSISPYPCPFCGNKIRTPFGGHTWTCHITYGGCGAQFRPVSAFEYVGDVDA